ncbi:hypothetical protein KVR01_006704 [Diaporthe batatas]|uniref:uncharacterized protein n=1 Tax=Diaporthe batatas TaxID=748121 RepID=UPI001D041B72|nr:uncharacterized protein KVR01_006704 [Diaporthe batatas]KAG8163407.1 hypothetical protein KVR01_006704 [Diaporthe batatas]
MPPKAKKAAASAPPAGGAPLDGCVIAFSGRFTGYKQSGLESKCTILGGQPAKSVVEGTTHVVTTQADYDKLCTKVFQAKDRGGIFIVSLDWLLDSEDSNTRQPEAQYLFDAQQSGNTNGSTNGNNNTVPTSKHPTPTNPQPVPVPAQNNPSIKRQASASPEPKPNAKKTKLDQVAKNGKAAAIGKEQIAKSWDVQVPVDEGCSLIGYGVHIDDDSVIWDASLNQTNAGANNNKFYRIQVLVSAGDAKTWTRWGRVGERGANKVLGGGSLQDAKKQFEKKFRDKTGLLWANRMDDPLPGKYVFLEKSYQPDSDSEEDGTEPSDGTKLPQAGPPPCTLEPAVQDLMKLIFNERYFAAAMTDMNYDLDKLPLGKLSKATIMRGFQTLKDLSALLDGSAAPAAAGIPLSVEDLSNRFYSLIPHNFGRNRPPIINNQATVKREIELLETLADMKDASNILKAEIDERNSLHPLDRQYRGLGMEEISELERSSAEFTLLKDYLINTRGQTHGVTYKQVESIFRIERKGEKDRFISDKISDRRLLWHGSRATNFGGILSQGLRIAPPEAPVSGYMFDKGIYLADMSSKSINYCCPYISDNTALLLLCEAELGKPMQELTNFQYDAAALAKEKGLLSTFGKGATGPKVWKDAECVHPSLKGITMPDTTRKPPGPTGVNGGLLYNEYIAYDVSQVRLRYLFRVKV